MQEVKIQVLFTEETQYGSFTDALYFTPEEYDTMTESDIASLRQARVNAWVSSIQNSQSEG